MAVTTTPEQLFEAAIPRSKLNLASDLASADTELLQYLARAMRGVYAFAARINPYYFGATQDQTNSGSGWLLPDDAESVYRIEGTGAANVPNGKRVWIVPFEDREAMREEPSVVFYGRAFHPAGNTTDPSQQEILRIFYSRLPIVPESVNDPIDPLWCEQYNELLVLEITIYLAIKDNDSGRRAHELNELRAQRDSWARLFAAHLQHVAPAVRRKGHVRQINVDTLLPLLAGGSGLEVGTAA